MISGKMLLPVCLLFFASPACGQNEGRLQAADLETRLLTALVNGNVSEIDAVGDAILGLSERERRGLKFRVRPGTVEFRLAGACLVNENVEFLFSSKIRDYESLLVLDELELARAAKVWKAGTAAKATQPPFLEFKLLWMEKDSARCEDVGDIFHYINRKQWKGFNYSQLTWENDGLRIANVALDQVTAPRTAQAAQILVILRPPFLTK